MPSPGLLLHIHRCDVVAAGPFRIGRYTCTAGTFADYQAIR
jgi:hypothetical protein